MSIFVTKKLPSVFIILICLLITPSHSRYCYYCEWSVNICNGIQDSSIDLHVKSGDDDLGHHNITFDHGYNFGFCENFFFNTLFWGNFVHGSQSAHFHVFDKEIVKLIGGRDLSTTNTVYWLLKQDGYYLSNELKPYDDPAWMFRGHWE